jgi:tetratricopeptide (TPR) repeat protein
MAVGLLTLATGWAYRGSFAAPFFFDDQPSIIDNPTIRHLGAIGQVLSPPAAEGSSVAGRPLVNLSLALNYAWGGLEVRGYHAVNLGIHVLAALTLFGITRRTLARSGAFAPGPVLPSQGSSVVGSVVAGDTDQIPWLLAFFVALLWALHPLQTESVTFVVQRTESLMGLFYLLTLYAFIRYADGKAFAAIAWAALSITACLLGMMTKEVMASAPLLVFLYDRTFVAGSFRAAWRRHGPCHAGLAATWLMLGYILVHAGGSRAGAAGFGMGVSSWSYALTQCRALMLYLQLAVWPHPLVVDYGFDLAKGLGEVAPQAACLVLLLAGTGFALWRRPVMGFLGAWFFVILAPSSSVVPLVTQTMAEHRMYLPLAAVVALAVGGGYALVARMGWGARGVPCYFAVLVAWSIGLGIITAGRNAVYRSALSIWSDTVAKRPGNPRAHGNLGSALEAEGRRPEAIMEFQAALRLKPDYAEPHNNLGNIYATLPGRSADAIAQYQEALRLKPDSAVAHFNLGNQWLREPGRIDDAIAQYREAVRLNPGYVAARTNLGSALAGLPGRLDEAIAEYQEVLRLDPQFAEVHFNLGNLWMRVPGRTNDAIAEYEETLRLKPDFAAAHLNLALALLDLPGRRDGARMHLEAALRLDPANEAARRELAGIRVSRP